MAGHNTSRHSNNLEHLAVPVKTFSDWSGRPVELCFYSLRRDLSREFFASAPTLESG